jgi:hypothetical protein
VVTDTLPVEPLPTTAAILVELSTVKEVAAVPPKLTAVAPVKFVPVMVIVVPEAPDVGVKELMVGDAIVKPVFVAVPPGEVTDTLPDEPAPTTAVMVVEFTTENDVAAVPPKLTAVAPVKFVPVMVTVPPTAEDAGVKDDMVGAAMVKPARVAVPPGVVTETLPAVPLPTTAVMLVELTTVNDVAAVPPKLTAVAPVKFVPVMVTVAPTAADVGVNDVMVGAGINVKPAEVAVPPGVVTVILPVVPAATTAVMLVALTTVKDVAAVPPNFTAVAPVKLVPVMVTVMPAAAEAGVNELMVGAWINVKPAKVAVPPGVVTDALPDEPLLTTAVILVELTTVKDVTAVPPKLTAVAPVKLVPVMVTVAPKAADVGVNDVMVGAAMINPVLVTVPPGAVTDMLPDVPLPTTAVMLVELTTVNELAAVPPKLTAVVPVKLVPVMVTVAPTAADAGVNEVMVGAATVNPARVAVPPGVVTEMLPDEPLPTTAVMLVALTTVNDVAAVPPKFTPVAPVKLVPVMVTVAPTAAVVGVNDVIVGAAEKPAKVAVPPGVVTETLPVEPLPTTAVMLVELTTVKEVAAVPPKLTAVAPVKLVPVIVIVAPEAPDVGVNEEMVGAVIVKPVLVAVPPGVVTDALPDVPLPTTAVIWVELLTVNDAAAVPPKLTAVAPVKLVPVIVTVPPTGAVAGVNEVMVGAVIVKPAFVPVPCEFVTATLPEDPLPTTAVICVVLLTV